MRFTDTNVTFHADTKVCVESPTQKGYMTPLQLALPALQGVEADPTKIGAEYLPEVLTPDYITLTDSSGDTIPANTLAQKAGVPYYGDSPLSKSVFQTVELLQCQVQILGTGDTGVLLAERSIAAADMVHGHEVYFDYDLILDGSGAGMVPHANDKFYIGMQIGTDAFDITKAALFPIQPTAVVTRLQGSFFGSFVDSGGLLRPSASSFAQNAIEAAGAAVDGLVKLANPVNGVAASAAHYADAGVANVVRIYFVLSAGQGDYAYYSNNGVINFTNRDVVTQHIGI